jgi:hypothetical protein
MASQVPVGLILQVCSFLAIDFPLLYISDGNWCFRAYELLLRASFRACRFFSRLGIRLGLYQTVLRGNLRLVMYLEHLLGYVKLLIRMASRLTHPAEPHLGITRFHESLFECEIYRVQWIISCCYWHPENWWVLVNVRLVRR